MIGATYWAQNNLIKVAEFQNGTNIYLEEVAFSSPFYLVVRNRSKGLKFSDAFGPFEAGLYRNVEFPLSTPMDPGEGATVYLYKDIEVEVPYRNILGQPIKSSFLIN